MLNALGLQECNKDAIEPMQVDISSEHNANTPERDSPMVENSTLDLDVYANNYTGLARLYRLTFIAEHCPNLRIDALKMAISYVKSTTLYVSMYLQLHRKLQETISTQLSDIAIGSALEYPTLDVFWVEEKTKQASLLLEQLDFDMNNFQSNSIKECIRRGNNDLGEHYLNCGDLNNALKCFSKARDYCTSSKHLVQTSLNQIKISCYLQNWSHVSGYINKAESNPYFFGNIEMNIAVASKIKSVAGLEDLMNKRYKSAAKNFLQVQFDYFEFPELLSPNNVAVYGGLCALATYDRLELKISILNCSSFKMFLELEPQLRDIIFKFYESKYASCLKLLDEIKDNLFLDMYLAPHVNTLYAQIRNRAFIQYFSPYLSADMRKMATDFNTTVNALENELMTLIINGQIKATIDSYNKILYAKDTDQRCSAFKKSIAVGNDYQRKTKFLILRLVLLENTIHVKAPKKVLKKGISQSVEIPSTAQH